MFTNIKRRARHKRLSRHDVEVSNLDASAIELHGQGDGMWPIYTKALPKDKAIIYSFGVGDDLSWEIDLIASSHNVEAFAYDPTPSSVTWVGKQELPSVLHFKPIGIADFCGEISFYIPRKEGKVNYSVVKRGRKYPNKTVHCEVQDITSICAENNHKHIDILKLDIEGAELSTLPDILDSDITVNQLLIELHYNYPGIDFKSTIELINKIKAHGFELFWLSDRAYEFGFVKTQ